MYTIMKEIAKRYVSISLPILFSIYVGFLIAFTHIHIVNGATIVHSHPYQKSEGLPVEHEHNYAEFQLLHQLSTIQITGALFAFFLLTASLVILYQSRITLSIPVIREAFAGSFSLRGPPYC
ncbi:MAG: hypothetical protein LIP01_11150 [Tannerellaceae bacterium]|nr:hypothetical protein [Tannerellaceae bacterium]